MEFTVGALLEGKVKSITKFGAFITLPENRTGMVHISEVANTYVSDIHDHLTARSAFPSSGRRSRSGASAVLSRTAVRSRTDAPRVRTVRPRVRRPLRRS